MDDDIDSKLLEGKHLLAIDYGKKFTGFATYKYRVDPFPLGYGRVAFESNEQLILEIKNIIDNEFIDIVIIGVPFFTDGKESSMTKEIKLFASTAEKKLPNIKVYTIDETLTTYEAEQRMLQDPKYNFKVDLKKIDELSAVIILEQFLKNSSNS